MTATWLKIKLPTLIPALCAVLAILMLWLAAKLLPARPGHSSAYQCDALTADGRYTLPIHSASHRRRRRFSVRQRRDTSDTAETFIIYTIVIVIVCLSSVYR